MGKKFHKFMLDREKEREREREYCLVRLLAAPFGMLCILLQCQLHWHVWRLQPSIVPEIIVLWYGRLQVVRDRCQHDRCQHGQVRDRCQPHELQLQNLQKCSIFSALGIDGAARLDLCPISSCAFVLFSNPLVSSWYRCQNNADRDIVYRPLRA